MERKEFSSLRFLLLGCFEQHSLGSVPRKTPKIRQKSPKSGGAAPMPIRRGRSVAMVAAYSALSVAVFIVVMDFGVSLSSGKIRGALGDVDSFGGGGCLVDDEVESCSDTIDNDCDDLVDCDDNDCDSDPACGKFFGVACGDVDAPLCGGDCPEDELCLPTGSEMCGCIPRGSSTCYQFGVGACKIGRASCRERV